MDFLLAKRYFLMTHQVWDRPPKSSKDDVAIGCPVCNEGSSRGKKQRLHLYQKGNYNEPMVHCFNCGIHHSLKNYLKIYFNDIYNQYRLDNFSNSIDSLRNGLTSNYNEDDEIDTTKMQLEIFKPEDFNLKEAKYSLKVKNYLLNERGLNEEDLKYFYFMDDKIKLDNKIKDFTKGVIIPLWYNFDKKEMLGFQYRSIYLKQFYIYLPEKNEGNKIYNYYNSKKEVYVFESVFDMLSNNIPFENKIALLGSSIQDDKLKKFRKVTFALDNPNFDETSKRKLQELSEDYNVVILPENIPTKDYNELLQKLKKNNIENPKEKIKRIIENNIYKGLEAQIKLKMI